MVLSQTRIICKSCGQERKFQDLIASNGELICKNCFERNKNGEPIEKKQEETKELQSNSELQNSSNLETEKEYKQFVCNECSYKFKFNTKSKAVLRCPNCGKENVQENNFTGDKLIDDSEGYDW